jgi:hypothetical protein
MSTKSRKKDEGFTNIRIREETREELRTIGRYSENMDDIVRKCLAAYNAITNSGGRVVNKIVVEEPVKEQTQTQQQYQRPESQQLQPQPQQQTHHQNQQSDTFGFGNDEISIKDKLRSELTIYVPGLKFPIKRDGLIRLAESFRNEFQNKYHKTSVVIEHPLYIIKKLPRDLVYKDKERLSYDLITIARKDNTLYINHYIRDGTPKYAGCNVESFNHPDIDNEKFKSHTMEVLNYVAQAELESKKRELEKWQPRSKEDSKLKERELKEIADALTYRPSSLNSLLNQTTQS